MGYLGTFIAGKDGVGVDIFPVSAYDRGPDHRAGERPSVSPGHKDSTERNPTGGIDGSTTGHRRVPGTISP